MHLFIFTKISTTNLGSGQIVECRVGRPETRVFLLAYCALGLKNNGYDPRLVNHVHIPRAKALIEPQTWAKHPYVVLHELAHSYHDQVLSFEHPEIKAAWDNAKETGILKDALLYTGRKVDHYGLTNHKEYFAESTEAYFGVNDFYPFVRAELKEHDPRMYETLEKVWGKIR